MKRVLKVMLNNEFATGPELAVVEVDGVLAARIIEISENVKRLGVDTISFVDATPDFFVRDLASADEYAFRESLDPDDCRVECVKLNVNCYEFNWSGIQKYTDTYFQTETTPLFELEKEFIEREAA
jgi:hypothetical protein